MEKYILLFVLFISATGCMFLEPAYYSNCVLDEKDGLYYNSNNNSPCTGLNKKIERERKRGY